MHVVDRGTTYGKRWKEKILALSQLYSNFKWYWGRFPGGIGITHLLGHLHHLEMAMGLGKIKMEENQAKRAYLKVRCVAQKGLY